MPSVISSHADRATGAWFRAGQTFVLATVVETVGSAPLPVGSAMAVGPDGTALGSVSGGCVEGAIYETACTVRDSGIPRLEQFGYSDSEALAVGLTCGGSITVLIEPISRKTFPHYGLLVAQAADDGTLGWARTLPDDSRSPVAHVFHHPGRAPVGSVGDAHTDEVALGELDAMFLVGATGIRRLPGTATRMFVRSLVPPPRLILIGATEYAAALFTLARPLDMRVTVCDARPVFATPQRFPDANEVVCEWPHRYLDRISIDGTTAVCVLTQDAKFDVPALLSNSQNR
jgi:xanthine dehydrogenase accessory factor